MSALTLTAGAKPVFLGPNRFNRHADKASDLIVSTQTALRHRLYDMTPAAYWISSGSNDSTQESIAAGLWDSGVQNLYDIDFIAVLGHNLANFTIELSADNGSTWPYSYAYTGQTASYTLRSLSSAISVNRFQLLMDTTQTANAEKQVGTIILALAQFQAPIKPHIYKRLPPIVTAKSALMYDKSKRRSFIGRSDAGLSFFNARCGFAFLTETQADQFESLCNGQDPFIFGPEPGDRPDEWYLGGAEEGTFTRDYVALSKSGGEAVTFDFREFGGA